MRDLSSFTDPLIRAHRDRSAFEPGPVLPTTVAEAYAVQTAVMETIGPVGGFKVSQKPGQPATMAPIPAARCFGSGATVNVPERVGVELEVGFIITDALPDGGDPDFRAKLIAAVRPAPMIELVATRLIGSTAEEAMPKLADLQANEGLVVGNPLDDWDGSDFGTVEISMASDAAEIGIGQATVPGGSALAALETMVRLAGSHCGGLVVGHRVITGTLHPLTFIDAGQMVRGHIAGLGSVSAKLIA